MTDALFTVETDEVALTWARRASGGRDPWTPPGRLVVDGDGVRVTCHGSVGGAPVEPPFGPRLDEETDYELYARPTAGGRVDVRHEDPVAISGLRTEADGTCHGAVNFRSNVGRSRFTVCLDGVPRFSFEVEVFPTKLDYREDYPALLAEVQDTATALALEYLRQTYRYGRAAAARRSSDLEWVVLLRHVIDDLERALRHVAARPRRRLVRRRELTPAHRVRRPDSAVRNSVRRGAGAGPQQSAGGLHVRRHVWWDRPETTLDTPEHRWLAARVRMARQRLRALRDLLGEVAGDHDRRAAQIAALREFDDRLAILERLEPLTAVEGPPPPGFTSQQLLTAPGYAEAYRACLILGSGLKLEGDAVRLSVAELHVLYEYWCYLAIVRLLNEHLDDPLDPSDLFTLSATGLRVDLQKGRAPEVRFGRPGRRVRVLYNPTFSADELVLVTQRPDVVVTVEHEGWPPMHLVIDAKYRRVDAPEYVERHGAAGPPDDAVNALHRYRDALLADVGDGPSRTTVQAVAAFPGRDVEGGRSFSESRHWAALQRIGVGSVPALPASTSHLEAWLTRALRERGWSLADRAIPHAADRALQRARLAAGRRALVVEVDASELDDLLAAGTYERPWQGDAQLLTTDEVAFLVPGTIASRAGRLVRAPVVSVDLRRRPGGDPWVVFGLGTVSTRRMAAVPGVDPPHTTTALALDRAADVSQLWVRSETEWRLLDQVAQRHALRAVEPLTDVEVGLTGPWLRTAAEERVRYAGADGYEVRSREEASRFFATAVDAVRYLTDVDAEP